MHWVLFLFTFDDRLRFLEPSEPGWFFCWLNIGKRVFNLHFFFFYRWKPFLSRCMHRSGLYDLGSPAGAPCRLISSFVSLVDIRCLVHFRQINIILPIHNKLEWISHASYPGSKCYINVRKTITLKRQSYIFPSRHKRQWLNIPSQTFDSSTGVIMSGRPAVYAN